MGGGASRPDPEAEDKLADLQPSALTLSLKNESQESLSASPRNERRRRSSIRIDSSSLVMGGPRSRKISMVLKRDSSSAMDHFSLPPVHEELTNEMKLEVLKFSTQINQSSNMRAILETVDQVFKRLFVASTVIIHLNPSYASKYQRFLRKHASQANKSVEDLISRLEIGFEENLEQLIGVRSLSAALRADKIVSERALKEGRLTSIKGLKPASSSSSSGGGDNKKDKYEVEEKDDSTFSEDDGESTSDMHALGCPIFSMIYQDNSGNEFNSLMDIETQNPDLVGRRVIAVCEIRRSPELQWPFKQEDAKLLAALSIHLGQSLERSCMESDLLKHLEWSKISLKMAETLNSQLDPVLLIETAIAQLRHALFAERGSMYLVDDEKREIWTMVLGSDTDCDDLKELRIPFGVGIAGHVAESGDIVVIPDAYQDDRFNKEIDRKTGLKTKSILCVPVFSQTKELVAVLQLVNKKDVSGGWTASFDQDDVDLLTSFSTHVSVALNNAKVTAKNKYNEEIANDLLNKMFPKHITAQLKKANELKSLAARNESCSEFPNEPIVEKYNKVFVFFSDIVGFTTKSQEWEPTEIVNLLNDMFTEFDKLTEKHNVYKLETIGDAYVACTNLPFMNEESERHAAENLARFAVDATDFIRKFVTRHGKKVEIRSGIHCGSCFGGVVGVRMPRFCLMGDTMNTASRMESTGSALKIHISQAFKEALEQPGQSPIPLTNFQFEDLGLMEVKGKGQMQTYFLNAPPEYYHEK